MNWNKKIILLSAFLFGLVVPFIPLFALIEIFFLLIPFAIIFVLTLAYLVVNLMDKKEGSNKAIFVSLILPTFILSQLLSGFFIGKIQRFRSDKIIAELEQIRHKTGYLPERYGLTAGIEYTRLHDNEHFIIQYSRGFMVTEKYNSANKNWESYGWND